MGERPSVGGLDQRFAPPRTGRARTAVLWVAVLVGVAGGVLFAMATVPDPMCATEDGICKLQRIYLAQAVKVVGGALVGFLVAETFVIRLPNTIRDRRRVRAWALEQADRPAAAAPRTFDAALARAALDAVAQGPALPRTALLALAADAERRLAAAAEATDPPSETVAAATPEPDPTAAAVARAALVALNAPAALPPAALRALSAHARAADAAPAAPEPPEPAAPEARPDPARVLDAITRPPGLPPAALEALMAHGPALRGGPRRPAPQPPEEPERPEG